MKFGLKLEGSYTGIIRETAIALGCETYLELGILEGENIGQIASHCMRAVGVDVQDRRKIKNFEFYKMTTDKFFETVPIHADIVFIDANHRFDVVKRDFENSLKILNQWGVIFLHDTDPVEKSYLEPEFCGDAYKIKDWIKRTYPKLNIFTLPVSVAGLTIVNRNENRLQ